MLFFWFSVDVVGYVLLLLGLFGGAGDVFLFGMFLNLSLLPRFLPKNMIILKSLLHLLDFLVQIAYRHLKMSIDKILQHLEDRQPRR